MKYHWQYLIFQFEVDSIGGPIVHVIDKRSKRKFKLSEYFDHSIPFEIYLEKEDVEIDYEDR